VGSAGACGIGYSESDRLRFIGNFNFELDGLRMTPMQSRKAAMVFQYSVADLLAGRWWAWLCSGGLSAFSIIAGVGPQGWPLTLLPVSQVVRSFTRVVPALISAATGAMALFDESPLGS